MLNFKRLPQAHTCINTLEIPNYLECMLELQHGGSSLEDLDGNDAPKRSPPLTERVSSKPRRP